MRKTAILFGLIVFLWLFSASVFAAEARRDVAIFDQPSDAAKQLKIVHLGDQVKITGSEESNSEGKWMPVTVDGAQGWVKLNALNLDLDDEAYVRKPPRQSRAYLFGSAGGGHLWGSTSVPAARLSGGFLARVSHDGDLVLGVDVAFPLSQESAPYPFDRVQRVMLEGTLGNYLIDDRLLLRGILGLDYVYSSDFVDSLRIGAVVGAGLSYQFPLYSNVKAGIELTYEYSTSSTQTSYNINTMTYQNLSFSSASLTCLNFVLYLGL